MELDDPGALRHKLNLETGKLAWQELQRPFARGVVIVVARELDLIDVAVAFASNDAAQTKTWLTADRIAHATDGDAQRWQAQNCILWSVVAAPWVLVQELDTESGAGA